ncbi:PH domain-containing protein [Micrococcus sp. FDAARGOS_333]|uniref:PH domain-containing protein n=1 Tax=Micrococcus sp. FDAARGOS_333 TaxID=1930558 RepID=UPI000FDA4A18|nr:PH domain-containing protein [Micrococcus sp. FDAARGOS_333]
MPTPQDDDRRDLPGPQPQGQDLPADDAPAAETERPTDAADAPATDTERPTDAEGWTRMHPLTPWVKSWTFLAVMLFIVGREFVEEWVDSVFGGGRRGGDSGSGGSGPDSIMDFLPAIGIAAGVILLLGVVFFLSWWFRRFRLTGTEVQLREGWLFRKNRQMRYDRLQAVDLQHPLIPRLFGLAAVKVEAADGGDTALELSFLKKDRAEQVRREILDHASGVADYRAEQAQPADGLPAEGASAPGPLPDDGTAPAASGSPDAVVPAGQPMLRDRDEGVLMLKVPPGRLVGSVMLSDSGPLATLIGFAGLLGAAGLFVGLMPEAWLGDGETRWSIIGLGAAGFAVPLLFAIVASTWSGLNKGWGFTVRHSRDGLKLRYGLTETNSQTVPPGRVQGVTIRQSLLWRPLGWYQVRVQVAGYGTGVDSERSLVLPVGPWEDVLRVLTIVSPEPGVAEGVAAELSPAELMHVAMHGDLTDGGFTHIPRRARAWFTWFTWRRTGFLTTSRLLLVRGGRFARRLEVAEHERIQDLRIDAGPVQRRLRVADVAVHLAGGKQVTVKAQDRAAAEKLFQHESQIAAVARRLKDRDQWMTPEELELFERQLQPAGAGAAAPAPAAQDPGRLPSAEAGPTPTKETP